MGASHEKKLQELESLKARFLKRALCVSKYTPSRLVHVLTRETFLVEDLRLQHMLPATEVYIELLQELQAKRTEIWEEFYTTDAMINREWTRGGYELRHTVTRLAVHGFHHKMCNAVGFHEPGPECVCVRCEQLCTRYHAMECVLRLEPITQLCQ